MIELEYRPVNGSLELCRILKRRKYARWSKYEDNLLKQNYQKMTTSQLAVFFARSIKSIESRILRLKLSKVPNWKYEEIFKLQNGDINISRSKTAIKVKMCRLRKSKRLQAFTNV
jgi:hypothetical protein